MELDKTNQAILNALIQDSRQSYRQIARKTHLSVATVASRVERLKKEGVIKKYSTILDFDKLGYDLQAIIELQVAGGKLFEVESKIAKHPNVYGVYDATGNFDIVIIARFKNRKGLDALVKKLQTIEHVARTQTKLILNTIKEEQISL